MVKKPKLSRSLVNYTKTQALKIKEKARFDAIELMNKNRAEKNSNAPRGVVPSEKTAVMNSWRGNPQKRLYFLTKNKNKNLH